MILLIKPTLSQIYHNENDEVPADKASRDEAKDDHGRELDTRDSTLRTPSVHKSIAPTIPGDNIENTNMNLWGLVRPNGHMKQKLHVQTWGSV
jgi:topoisomerase (DNA) II binding protein 1